jgi:hypothetical protein
MRIHEIIKESKEGNDVVVVKDLSNDYGIAPGETKDLSGDVKPRDIEKIQEKIHELRDDISRINDITPDLQKTNKSGGLVRKDAEKLLTTLNMLERRLQMKVSYLHNMKSRPTTSAKNLIEKLKTECSEIFDIFKQSKKVLYIGTDSSSTTIFFGRSPENNVPVSDAAKHAQDIFNNILKEEGFELNLTNTILTNSDKYSMDGYEKYIILPKNGFKFFTFNGTQIRINSISDLVTDRYVLANKLRDVLYWCEDKIPDFRYSDEKYKIIDHIDRRKFVEAITLINQALEELKKLKEKQPDLYPTVPDEYLNMNINNYVDKNTIIDRFKPSTDILPAVNYGYGVYIHGSYYALHEDQWGRIIKNLISKKNDDDEDLELPF